MLKKLLKIAVVSLIVGLFIRTESMVIFYYFPQTLSASKIWLLIALGSILGAGGLFFLILAKIFGIIDFAEIIKALKKRK